MTITNFVPQARGTRFNLFLDNKFAFGVSTFVATKYKLSESVELDKGEVKEVYIDERIEYCKKRAMDYLSARPRSEKEVRDKLLLLLSDKQYLISTKTNTSSKSTKNTLRKDLTFIIDGSCNEQIVESTIDFLQKYKYLSDINFAKWIVEQRTNQGKGTYYIKQDLIKKGVPKEVITEVMFSVDTSGALEKSYEKALKKYGKESNPYKKKQKIQRYLVSRGFSFDEINRLLE